MLLGLDQISFVIANGAILSNKKPKKDSYKITIKIIINYIK